MAGDIRDETLESLGFFFTCLFFSISLPWFVRRKTRRLKQSVQDLFAILEIIEDSEA